MILYLLFSPYLTATLTIWSFKNDSLFFFLQTLDSQIVPDDWKKLDPEMMKSIEADGKKGDFLAIVGRRELDDELSQVFIKICFLRSKKKIPFLNSA